MSKQNGSDLIESFREAGAIIRGEVKPAREYQVRISGRRTPPKVLGICVETDDPESVIPNKLYRLSVLDKNYVLLKDEAGESAIYPSDHFIFVSFPPAIERRLSRLAQQ